MIKKVSVYFIFFFIVSCAGYEPIFSPQNFNFSVSNIKFEDNDKVSKKISKRLTNLSKDNSENRISINLNSSKEERILSKDSKGNPLIFEMSLSTNLEILFANGNIKKYLFIEKFNFNNQSDKFELAQYKKITEENLIDKIFENILNELRKLDDN